MVLAADAEHGQNTRCGIGIGIAPFREVITTALQKLLVDPAFWEERAGYHVPRVSPLVVPPRLCVWKTFGTLLALHLVHVRTAPEPVSPFLVLFLLGGRRVFKNNSSML